MKHLTTRAIVASLAIAMAFLVLTWPIWRWLWGEWWGNDYYSHGLLIVPIALYLGWRRLQQKGDFLEMQGDDWGVALLGISLVAYLLAYTNRAYFLAALAMVGLLGGLLWTFGGRRWLRELLFPLAFLLLMVPLPFIDRATLPLALLTGICSGTLASWLGLDVAIVGTAVSLPNAELVIGAQCSGINSMISLFALTTLVAYILQGPLWGRFLLVFLSVPLAMIGNILRVATLLFVARSWGVQTAFTFYHDYSGIVAFLLIFLLLIPLSKSLQCRTLRYEVL